MKKKIFVVVAHPDDEILGVGGAIIKHVNQGDEVNVLILGEGMRSRDNTSKEDLKKLHCNTDDAKQVMGYGEVYFSNFPDNSFDTVSLLEITKEVEKYIDKLKPDVVYTHHEYDLNIDHRLTFQAVLTACRPCNTNCPTEILSFESLSSTEWQSKFNKQFQPNFYVDITDVIEKKVEALQKYISEIKDYPHSRSVQGVRILSQYRGLEAGLEHAEAFCLVRKIQK